MISLDLPGSPVAFDLGGLPLAGGGVVAPRRLLRSGYTSAFTPAAVRTLRSYGVTDIVDLRSPRESAKLPQTLRTGHGFAYHRVAVGGDRARPEPGVISSLTELYRMLVAEHGRSLWTAIERIVSVRNGAALVHCQTGRDRTGLVAALVLRLAGAPDSAVVGAHRRVEHALEQPLVQRRAAWVAKGRDGAYFDALNVGAAAALERALAWIDAHHGDTVGYVRAHGAPDDVALRTAEALADAVLTRAG